MRFDTAIPLLPLVTLLSPVVVQAAHLQSVTSQAWQNYLKSATLRMEHRLSPGQSFLWADEAPDRLERLRAGEIVVSPVGRNPIQVPSGLIHHWIGAVFIPDVSLGEVQQVVRDYARYKDLYQPGVIDSKVIAVGGDRDRFSMVLLNKSLLLKLAFHADYESRTVQVDDRCAYSVSRTTQVREVEEFGSSGERALPEGEGHGIIWSLSGITRYMQRDGGVYIELEAIALSRDIPGSMRWLVEPMVRRVSRSSLLTTLQQTQRAVRTRNEMASEPVKSGISF